MYNISEIHYRDVYGRLLWKTDMIFRTLHAVGETLVWDNKSYIVERVAVADTVQHVNLDREVCFVTTISK